MAKKAVTNLSSSKIVEETPAEKIERLERENQQLRAVEDDYEIRLDSYIEVMSLFDGKLNLSTQPSGKGNTFKFSKFGETKRILYNDLASVMENYRSFLEEGMFDILNPKVIRKHGLDDIYEKILKKESIEKVLKCDSKSAIKIYNSATKSQKETIDGMLVQKLKNGEEIDLNIVSEISKISGSDLKEIAERFKTLETTPA